MTFLNITCPLLEARLLKQLHESFGILPNCLFYLYYTKSIFRPTSGHLISTFSGSYSLEQKVADFKNFAKKLCDAFQFSLNTNLVLANSEIFAYLNSPWQGLFKNVLFIIFRALLAFTNILLNNLILQYLKFFNFFFRLFKYSPRAFQICIKCYGFVSH